MVERFFKKPSNYKISKFWGSTVQPGDYSYQYCIAYLRITKRDLNISHHKKNKLISM